MTLAWCTSSFAYYMFSFYTKYLPGDIYTIIIVVGIAESAACICSGFLGSCLGCKMTMGLSFLFAGVGAFMFMLTPVDNQVMTLVALLMAKSGVSSSFVMCYISTVDFFPREYSSSFLGVCN